MRKPRDFDAELKALSDKAASLKRRKVEQLGELVIATGADKLPVDLIAGALLAAVDSKDTVAKEAIRKRGAAFFRNDDGVRRRARAEPTQRAQHERGDLPAASETGAA